MAGSKPIEQRDDSRAALCESCASCRQQRDPNCHLRLSFIHMGHGPGLRPAKAENTCKVQTAWSCLTRSLEQSSSQQFRLHIQPLVLSQAVTGKHGSQMPHYMIMMTSKSTIIKCVMNIVSLQTPSHPPCWRMCCLTTRRSHYVQALPEACMGH